MAGKQSSFILQEDIAKLASLLGGKDCILLGGSALPFYGVNRGTKDIDAEIPLADLKLINTITSSMNESGIDVDISSSVSG